AVAGLHFLDDLRLDLPRQLTPGFSGVLRNFLAELAEIQFPARAADVASGSLAAAALARLRLAAPLSALAELVRALVGGGGCLFPRPAGLAGLALAKLLTGLAHLILRLVKRLAGSRRTASLLPAGHLLGRLTRLLRGPLHRLGCLVASLPGLLRLAALAGLPARLHFVAGPLRADGGLFPLLPAGAALLGQLVELLPDVAGLVLELLLPGGLLGTTRPGVF